jgi:hypothetical protein
VRLANMLIWVTAPVALLAARAEAGRRFERIAWTDGPLVRAESDAVCDDGGTSMRRPPPGPTADNWPPPATPPANASSGEDGFSTVGGASVGRGLMSICSDVATNGRNPPLPSSSAPGGSAVGTSRTSAVCPELAVLGRVLRPAVLGRERLPALRVVPGGIG